MSDIGKLNGQDVGLVQCRLGLNGQPFLTDGEEKGTVKQVEDMLSSIIAKKARRWFDTLDPIVGV